MNSTMKLLIDVGNRRVKWATTQHGDDLVPGGEFEFASDADATVAKQLTSQLQFQFAHGDHPSSVWVSCVAGAEIKKAITEYVHEKWALQPVFISAEPQQCGIINRYQQAGNLGSDRWAAVIAAGDLFPKQSVIVVDAGTAVTVDLLDSEGVFRGGVIFPGVQTMKSALISQTAHIQAEATADKADIDSGEQASPVATDTQSAITDGALLAVAGGINLTVASQKELLQTECRVVVTGGDAERLARWITTDITINPQLVLWGLAVISSR